MDWQLKIKLVAMINDAESLEDRNEIREFISGNLQELDHQGLGIVVRALDLSKEHLQEDVNFGNQLKSKIESLDLDRFSGSEKNKITKFYQNLNALNVNH